MVGIQTGIALELHPVISIALGTITACFGGVIRDISLSNIPLNFQEEIYATTCIVGGIVFFILLKVGVPTMPVEVICLITIVVFRLLSVKYHWHLPVIWKVKESEHS
ncbi:TRIC cation channel family protein [Membranicola marinus]|uniref:TRIC cation channel family protein n=1 Tax=Membranihabitans marinus TaxID=1227546 RepID=A0A953L6Z7_9BACT|nr:TRIC cation channel family protein [Membranihabitans marinus]